MCKIKDTIKGENPKKDKFDIMIEAIDELIENYKLTRKYIINLK